VKSTFLSILALMGSVALVGCLDKSYEPETISSELAITENGETASERTKDSPSAPVESLGEFMIEPGQSNIDSLEAVIKNAPEGQAIEATQELLQKAADHRAQGGYVTDLLDALAVLGTESREGFNNFVSATKILYAEDSEALIEDLQSLLAGYESEIERLVRARNEITDSYVDVIEVARQELNAADEAYKKRPKYSALVNAERKREVRELTAARDRAVGHFGRLLDERNHAAQPYLDEIRTTRALTIFVENQIERVQSKTPLRD